VSKKTTDTGFLYEIIEENRAKARFCPVRNQCFLKMRFTSLKSAIPMPLSLAREMVAARCVTSSIAARTVDAPPSAYQRDRRLATATLSTRHSLAQHSPHRFGQSHNHTDRRIRMAARKSSGRRKYGEAASKRVESAMRRRKKGTLKSGKGGKGGKVTSRKQAIAIGLSEARKKGAKVPRKRGGTKRS